MMPFNLVKEYFDMRNDLYFTRLYGIAHQDDAKPKALARAMLNTLLQASEISPVGAEALALVRNKILRTAFQTQFGIGTRKRRSKKEKTEVKHAATEAKRKPGRPRKVQSEKVAA
jgi:hypothetical protein